jgi:mono/diheme cytochrome c family protein
MSDLAYMPGASRDVYGGYAPGGEFVVMGSKEPRQAMKPVVSSVRMGEAWEARVLTGVSMERRWPMHTRKAVLSALVLGVGVMLVVGGWAQEETGGHTHAMGTSTPESPRGPVRISDEELHRLGGVPPGWHFTFPAGDPTAGRAVFAKLECYQCHAIQGEQFPMASKEPGKSGPDLTGMGSHHPTEYFAESILNPNAVIATEPGYTDAHGLSIMPDYRESLTVAELIDLVAYLKSLGGEHSHAGGMEHGGEMAHASHPPAPMRDLEQVVGDYRVRLVYQEAEAVGHGHGEHGGGATMPHVPNHLMVSITDVQTGAPVPYLPVSATIQAGQKPPRTIKLIPMMSDEGFHYGTDVTLPKTTSQITLSIRAATMQVMPSVAGRFSKPQKVSFSWGSQRPSQSMGGSQMPGMHGHGHEPSGEKTGH